MNLLLTPQIRDGYRLSYVVNGEKMKASTYKMNESEMDSSEMEKENEEKDVFELENILVNELYYDFSDLVEGHYYFTKEPVMEVRRKNGEIEVTLLSYQTNGEAMPDKEIIVQEEIFELPEGAEFVKFEELSIPEPAPDPLVEMRAENKALELRLETMKRQAEDDRKQNEATTLAILELMMSII